MPRQIRTQMTHHQVRLNMSCIFSHSRRYLRRQSRETWTWIVLLCGLIAVVPHASAGEVRIKAITSVEGVRINQLTGMGLVVGLNGTGGTNPITRQFAQNLVQNFGQRADPMQRLAVALDMMQRTDNLSVVTVTADLPIFAREGSLLDVTVAAFDDAESLNGGTLIATPLFGADDCVYAVASGPISTGGFSFSGDAGNVTKNHPTTGRISNGATVEKRVHHEIGRGGSFRLLLRQADFETARRMVQVINAQFPGTAAAQDAGTVNVLIPSEFQLDPVAFVGLVRSLTVVPDAVPRVVINERTGTVVVGQEVQISSVAIAHANLAVVTSESPEVSQPAPFSDGVTAVVPRTDIRVSEEKRPVVVLGQTTTVGELAEALNLLGVTPRDLSAIFQQLDAAGALHADLEFQ